MPIRIHPSSIDKGGLLLHGGLLLDRMPLGLFGCSMPGRVWSQLAVIETCDGKSSKTALATEYRVSRETIYTCIRK
ncbi:hypothetical protein SBA5_120072 [Candidatus Sulfotelmatomonas gaucii]|uniref:Uncharacterized protein n=1 Tax=Candidatus Sulfuritelmatomonas gaucii TaxID=2043161 RepID=A0A2N9L3W2_9BACT|nr:hypothetical protein SBA5_120072 [Candidatus Sulfotelmatomonas gaucii]